MIHDSPLSLKIIYALSHKDVRQRMGFIAEGCLCFCEKRKEAVIGKDQ